MAINPLVLQQQRAELNRLVASGQFPAAFELAGQLHKQAPRDAGALILLAHAQRGLGRVKDALISLEKADALNPGHPSIAGPRGMLMMKAGRWDDARKLYAKSLANHPADAGLVAAAAQVEIMAGQHERAWQLLKPVVDAAMPDPPGDGQRIEPTLVLTFAKLARLHRVAAQERRAIAALNALIGHDGDASALPPVHRSAALFELGALFDCIDEPDAAFDAYSRANALRRVMFDPADNARRFTALKHTWTRSSMATLPRPSVDGSRVLLIVGMPRSATSLVEQILASHPKIAGGDELPDLSRLVHSLNPTPSHLIPMMTALHAAGGVGLTKASLEKHARSYLETLRNISASAAFVTDKMPLNFLHLGLVQAMLPGACVIHCRRDPLDTCVSCFFQNFGGNNAFAYDLRHLGAFYREYESLISHWKAELDLPMLEVVYEDFFGSGAGQGLEAQVRRMLDFLGLPFDEACLRFHENSRVVQTASHDQVRRPLFASSVKKWKTYEHHLGPLIQALGPTHTSSGQTRPMEPTR